MCSAAARANSCIGTGLHVLAISITCSSNGRGYCRWRWLSRSQRGRWGLEALQLRRLLLRPVAQGVVGEQQNLVVARAGGHPEHGQAGEGGFEVVAFVADLQHQHTVLGKSVVEQGETAGFARPVAADQADRFARVDGGADLVEQDLGAVAQRDVF